MRGLRAKRVRMVKEGTLIATVDIGVANNTGIALPWTGEIPSLSGSTTQRKDSRNSGV